MCVCVCVRVSLSLSLYLFLYLSLSISLSLPLSLALPLSLSLSLSANPPPPEVIQSVRPSGALELKKSQSQRLQVYNRKSSLQGPNRLLLILLDLSGATGPKAPCRRWKGKFARFFCCLTLFLSPSPSLPTYSPTASRQQVHWPAYLQLKVEKAWASCKSRKTCDS